MIDDSFISKAKDIVFSHVDKNQYRVFFFGSRVEGTNKPFSDFDIGIEGKTTVPGHLLEHIREDFENSDIPFFVDIVDFRTVDDTFKKVAQNRKYLN